MRRRYPPRPLAGVGMLVEDQSRILMVKRRYKPGKGRWSVPGGLVELGETVREAVKREVKEETGIEVEIERLLDVVDNIVYDERGRIRFHYILIDFLGHPVGGDLKAETDAEDVQWVRLEDIDGYHTTKMFKRLLKKLNLE
jgi:mutator protein MutT